MFSLFCIFVLEPAFVKMCGKIYSVSILHVKNILDPSLRPESFLTFYSFCDIALNNCCNYLWWISPVLSVSFQYHSNDLQYFHCSLLVRDYYYLPLYQVMFYSFVSLWHFFLIHDLLWMRSPAFPYRWYRWLVAWCCLTNKTYEMKIVHVERLESDFAAQPILRLPTKARKYKKCQA